MVTVAFLVVAAIARPYGHMHDCNTNGATEPGGFNGVLDSGFVPTIACVHLNCTLGANKPFRGFIVSTASGAVAHGDKNGQQGLTSSCITHTSRADKLSIGFTVSETTTIWAMVVTMKGLHHIYNIVGPVVATALVKRVYVIGAGPGGLAAARYAASQNHNVTVFERGGHPPAGFYDNIPILQTGYYYLQQVSPELFYSPLNATNYQLVSMVGGNQAVNGAVFAPGAPEDLADSVGVTVAAASTAQELAGSYVYHVNASSEGSALRPVGLMQECMPSAGCDHSYIAGANPTAFRRSVGYNLPNDTIDIVVNATVTLVTDNEIVFENRPTISLESTDTVVLAAGALTSPQLLGQKYNICGYNHYYTLGEMTSFNYTGTPPTQHFQYFSDGWEHNIAKVNETLTYNISMQMDTDSVLECHNWGQSYREPPGAGGTQAWHYMGTIQHTGFRAPNRSKVYVGDASALMKPFNCHTSMPAAAAGIMAVQAAFGTLEFPPLQPALSEPGKNSGEFMYLFSAGVFLLAVGVFSHALGNVLDNDRIRKWHYSLMTVGVLTILAAVAWVWHVRRNDPNGTTLSENMKHHQWLGRVVAIGLILQVAMGSWVHRLNRGDYNTASSFTWRLRAIHRFSGFALLGVIAFMTYEMANSNAPYMYRIDTGLVRPIANATAYILMVLTTITLVGFASWKVAREEQPWIVVWFQHRQGHDQKLQFENDQTTLMETLM